jgi:uncharacterized SAM-binding protein YcdF (DUF218 family)
VEWLITNSIAAWLLPPGCLLLLAAAGAFLARRRARAGRALVVFSLLALYALSTSVVSSQLRRWLEPAHRDPLSDRSGQAIVVLGGGSYPDAPEYGADAPTMETLVRLRYGAHLHRALKKPLLVTGGTVRGNRPEAVTMKAVLEREFQTPVQWIEQRSRNTLENARLSRAVLDAEGIRRIYLVTQAWHMPRARIAFEHYGFTVIPAGTGFARPSQLTPVDFLPSAGALHESSMVFHEVIGIGWYHLRLLVGR